MGLPSLEEVASHAAAQAEVMRNLVRESLSKEWRDRQVCDAEGLDALVALTVAHLNLLEEPRGGGDLSPHEETSAACFKLARNLCVEQPNVQEYWWSSGLVARLTQRVVADVALADERGAAWSEAVPGFLLNVVAGNVELRARAVEAWFPATLAAACALCWRRPELAFMLVQTLVASEDLSTTTASAMPLAWRLVETEDGHCVVFILLSLLFRGGVGIERNREQVGPKAWEWASIFLHGLFMGGGFKSAYSGLREMTVGRLHGFWCTTTGVPAGSPQAPPGVLERLVGRLCQRTEVLALLWNTVHALDSKELFVKLLADEDFLSIFMQEFVSEASDLAMALELQWHPQVSAEACAAMGVPVKDFDMMKLSSDRTNVGEDGGSPPKASGELFGELCLAISALASAPRPDAELSPRLVATCLVVCTTFLDALHRLRFGDLAAGISGTLKRTPPPEAAEASRTCHHIEQVRVCANMLYQNRKAQDFLRLNDGLRVLLSQCYADEELPLLREVAVFAVNNATRHNLENQEAARLMLAERRVTEQNADATSVEDEPGFHPLHRES